MLIVLFSLLTPMGMGIIALIVVVQVIQYIRTDMLTPSSKPKAN